jgi:hypothetical protein
VGTLDIGYVYMVKHEGQWRHLDHSVVVELLVLRGVWGVAAGAGHGGGAKVVVAKFIEQVGLPSAFCSGLRPNGGDCQ